jgi:hypothetical protein
MALQCPTGYRLYNALCWEKCPPQMSVLATDPTLCVSSVPCPPTISTQDLVDASVCNKVVFPVNASGACANASYTQWVAGECLANCPPGYVDGGQTCMKRTIDRNSVSPSCSSALFSFDGSACRVNTLTYMLGAALLVAAALWTTKCWTWGNDPPPCAPQARAPRYLN